MVRVGLWQWCCCCCLAAEVLLLLLRTRLEDLQEDTSATAERVDVTGGVRGGIDGCGSVYEAGGHRDVREGRVDEAVPYRVVEGGFRGGIDSICLESAIGRGLLCITGIVARVGHHLNDAICASVSDEELPRAAVHTHVGGYTGHACQLEARVAPDGRA